MTKARTVLALGVSNVARAVSYRLGVKLGLNRVRRLRAAVPQGPFFQDMTLGAVHAPAVASWQVSAQLFSHWPIQVTSHPPDWLANPLTGQRIAAPERGWWQIPDFDPSVGDIKLIWELSRMDWVLAFAQRARNGDAKTLAQLNDWLSNWCAHNPAYLGPNWKCGQEASIRIMHLAMAALILGQTRCPSVGLRDMIQLHLQRIAPTVQYAMAQDNNHGTSEAAALFIGGSWLAALEIEEGKKWQATGRRWLEDRAARLIGVDGSFSQYSLNYHRVLLDTFCMADLWRQHLELPAFSTLWKERACAATLWLYHMVNPLTGDAPNLGANDGARLLQLTDSAYRDHRPTVQLSMALFANQRAYDADGQWNNVLYWLGVSLPKIPASKPNNWISDEGGFAVLRHGSAMVMLRYPRFRFRPSQADALHLDLWLGANNLLRDAGSYSYNTDALWLNYFGGTAGHNTIQFDDRDQMPRLSRFLFGDWLKTSFIEPLSQNIKGTSFTAGYRDGQHASHRRHVTLGVSSLRVIDDVNGLIRKAVLRWRLAPGDWQLEGHSLSNGAQVLNIHANVPIVRCELIEGWESRHYLEKTPLPVLEIEVQQPGTLTTEYHWAA